MRESFSIQPSGLCSWSNRTACNALPADTCKSAALDQSDVSSAHSACFLVNSVASTFLDACAKALASSHWRRSCVARTPTHETRRLSDDHVEGVEVVRHRDDAVDATGSSEKFGNRHRVRTWAAAAAAAFSRAATRAASLALAASASRSDLGFEGAFLMTLPSRF